MMGSAPKSDGSLTVLSAIREMSGYLKKPWGAAASFL